MGGSHRRPAALLIVVIISSIVGQVPMRSALAAPGDFILASLYDSGAQVTTNPHQPFGTHWVTDDGRYVVFASDEQLTANDTNTFTDIFVRDVVNNTTTLVSVSHAGVSGNAASSGASISADGHYAIFMSEASTLLPPGEDTNGQFDIFRRDLWAAPGGTGATVRVNVTPSGGQAQHGRLRQRPRRCPGDHRIR